MVAIRRDDVQRADCVEALGASGEVADRATEADAGSDSLLARQTGFACAPDLVASAATEGSVGRVDQWIETPRLPIPLRA